MSEAPEAHATDALQAGSVQEQPQQSQAPEQKEQVPEQREQAPENGPDVLMDSEDDDETVMSLPLSKIKRILKMDPDYFGSSATAVYAAGAATELFVQYLVEQASMNAKVDKRKKIQYKDLSSAVSSQEALLFLNDAIPKTQLVREALKEKTINLSEEDRKKYDVAGEDGSAGDPEAATGVEHQGPESRGQPLPKGQSTLPFASEKINKAGISNLMDNDAMQVD